MIERDEEREHEKSDERKLVLTFKFRGSIHTHHTKPHQLTVTIFVCCCKMMTKSG